MVLDNTGFCFGGFGGLGFSFRVARFWLLPADFSLHRRLCCRAPDFSRLFVFRVALLCAIALTFRNRPTLFSSSTLNNSLINSGAMILLMRRHLPMQSGGRLLVALRQT